MEKVKGNSMQIFAYALPFILFINVTSINSMNSNTLYFNADYVNFEKNNSWKEFDIKSVGKVVEGLINPSKIQNIINHRNAFTSKKTLSNTTDLKGIDKELQNFDEKSKPLYTISESELFNYYASPEWKKYPHYSPKDIVTYALKKKLDQYPPLKTFLKDTPKVSLVYDDQDPILGQNPENNPQGQNIVGEVLMEIREALPDTPEEIAQQLLQEAADKQKNLLNASKNDPTKTVQPLPPFTPQSVNTGLLYQLRKYITAGWYVSTEKFSGFGQRFSAWHHNWWQWLASKMPTGPRFFGRSNENEPWKL